MNGGKGDALMPRCKSEALRIRQRKGRRNQKKGHNDTSQCSCHLKNNKANHYDSEYHIVVETADFEPETENSAKKHDKKVFGVESKDSGDEDITQDSLQYHIAEMYKASEKAGETELDSKYKQCNRIQQHVQNTRLPPECRHSSDLSDKSSPICHEIKERAGRISKNYKTLHEILLRHEPIIQARWAKKRLGQRQTFLLQLWPDMPQNHRPDFYVFRSSRAQRGNRKYRHCYMLPHINQNDLTMQDSLPLLINSRAFYTPSHFVDIDLQSMKLGLQTGILKSVSLPGYSMVLLDAETIDDYGKLVDISKYSEEEILDLDKTHITPYYGILLLEAQDRLMAFLVSCCKQILHDIPEENLVSEKFPISIGSPKFLNNSGVYGPAVMAAQAPYRVPGKPDFKQIGLLLGAKMEQIKDHLLNLREDPAYFANTIKMMKDYSAKVWDVHTNTHFLLSGKSKTNLFSFLQYMIAKPYADFEFFSDLYEKNQQLERLHTEYEADIIPFKGVPDEILKALCKYQMSLWESIDFRRLILIRVIRSSSVWFRHFNDSADSLNSFRRDVGNYKASSVRRHLIWLLQCVTEWDPKLPRLIKPYHLILPLLMDGIETLRENEPEAWELTSSLTGEIIDELAILTKCMEKVNLYLLQTRRYERPTAGGKSIYTNLVNDELDYLHPLLALEHEAYFSVTEFEEIATKTLVYPWDKRRTKENVRAMQKAERDLDTFWDAADSFIFNRIKLFHEFPVGKHITSIKRTLQRTPDWIEEEGSIIPRPVRQRKASQGDDEDYKPPFAPCDDQSDSPGKFRQDSRHCLQIKVKTKGQAHKAVAQVDLRAIEEVTSESMPLIPVDKRALKVFRVLFYNPDVTSSPGEVPWNDFIHAMVCTGFSAQKLQGSIWQFSRLNHGGHQTILFHEPHPHKKVPFCAARSIGWRLNRHFQWSLESFVLKKKQTEVLE